MTCKKYLLILGLVAAAGWSSLSLVIFKLEPCSSSGEAILCQSVSPLALGLFFLSAFFALTASFALLGFGLRIWLNKNEIYLDHLNISIRQGLLLTFCSIGAMTLLLLRALTWWSGLLLICIIVFLELYFTRDI